MIPAHVTSMSSLPDSAAAATAASTSSREVTSQRIARPPIRSAVSVAAASSKSATTTCSPSDSSRSAIAPPMPRAPPVTRTILPANALTGHPQDELGDADRLVAALALDRGEDVACPPPCDLVDRLRP